MPKKVQPWLPAITGRGDRNGEDREQPARQRPQAAFAADRRGEGERSDVFEHRVPDGDRRRAAKEAGDVAEAEGRGSVRGQTERPAVDGFSAQRHAHEHREAGEEYQDP
jgi:hypothetical protein